MNNNGDDDDEETQYDEYIKEDIELRSDGSYQTVAFVFGPRPFFLTILPSGALGGDDPTYMLENSVLFPKEVGTRRVVRSDGDDNQLLTLEKRFCRFNLNFEPMNLDLMKVLREMVPQNNEKLIMMNWCHEDVFRFHRESFHDELLKVHHLAGPLRKLLSLAFENSKLSPAAYRAIFKFIQEGNKLRDFSLRYSPLESVGFKLLTKLLWRNTTLRRLALLEVSATRYLMLSLLKPLTKQHSKRTLDELYFLDWKVDIDELLSDDSFTDLVRDLDVAVFIFGAKGITKEHVKNIAHACCVNTTMKVVNFIVTGAHINLEGYGDKVHISNFFDPWDGPIASLHAREYQAGDAEDNDNGATIIEQDLRVNQQSQPRVDERTRARIEKVTSKYFKKVQETADERDRNRAALETVRMRERARRNFPNAFHHFYWVKSSDVKQNGEVAAALGDGDETHTVTALEREPACVLLAFYRKIDEKAAKTYIAIDDSCYGGYGCQIVPPCSKAHTITLQDEHRVEIHYKPTHLSCTLKPKDPTLKMKDKNGENFSGQSSIPEDGLKFVAKTGEVVGSVRPILARSIYFAQFREDWVQQSQERKPDKPSFAWLSNFLYEADSDSKHRNSGFSFAIKQSDLQPKDLFGDHVDFNRLVSWVRKESDFKIRLVRAEEFADINLFDQNNSYVDLLRLLGFQYANDGPSEETIHNIGEQLAQFRRLQQDSDGT